MRFRGLALLRSLLPSVGICWDLPTLLAALFRLSFRLLCPSGLLSGLRLWRWIDLVLYLSTRSLNRGSHHLLFRHVDDVQLCVLQHDLRYLRIGVGFVGIEPLTADVDVYLVVVPNQDRLNLLS